MSDHQNLAALLADPARAAEVPAEERQAVLDALAMHEGRCQLVRELLIASLTGSGEAKNGSARPQPPYALQEAAALLHKSTAWLQRKAKTGRVPGRRRWGAHGCSTAHRSIVGGAAVRSVDGVPSMHASESIEIMPCNRGRKRKPARRASRRCRSPWIIVTQGIRLVRDRYEKEETR